MRKDLRDYKVNGREFAYLFDCIHSDEVELTTDKEKVDYFFECFRKEFNNGYYRRMYPNLQDRIAQYLQGLPSCIGIAYTYHDILKLKKEWGVICDDTRFIEKWFSVLASRLIQMWRYFND